MRFFTKLVKPKNALQVAVRCTKIVELLKEELKEIDWNKSKYEPSIIEYVCNLVECEFHKKKPNEKKVDKKNVVLDVIAKLVGLTDSDKQIIAQIIEHLHSTGRITLPKNSTIFRNLAMSFSSSAKN
jgi:hypothetical protein